jgi:predicted nucleotidyltransferase
LNRDEIIAALRAHEAELRAAGVAGLSLVGSAARGEPQSNSDIDVLVRFEKHSDIKGLAYFGRMDQLTNRLEAILNRPVDVIAEPVRRESLRREFERDRTIAF